MATAGITRSEANLSAFLETIQLVPVGGDWVLESTNELISKIKRRPTGDEVEAMIKVTVLEFWGVPFEQFIPSARMIPPHLSLATSFLLTFSPSLPYSRALSSLSVSRTILSSFPQAPMGEGEESIHALLVTGLVELCKVKPVGIDAVQWLGEWLLANNPRQPKVTVYDFE